MQVKMSPSTSLSSKTPDTEQVRCWRALLQVANQSCSRDALLLGSSELSLFKSRENHLWALTEGKCSMKVLTSNHKL